MRVKLTQKTLAEQAARADGRRVELLDTEQEGLGARLGKRGWTFTLNYVDRDGHRRRNKRLGKAGKLSLEQARAITKQIVGADAVAHALPGYLQPPDIPEAPPVVTFGELLTRFRAYIKKKRKHPDKEERRLKRYLNAWADEPVTAITPDRIVALWRRIGEQPCERPKGCIHGGPGKCQGHPAQANVVLDTIGQIFRVAYKRSEGPALVPHGHNPAEEVAADYYYPPPPKHDRSATADEVIRLRDVLWDCRSWVVRAAVWLFLLTGARKFEALSLPWAHVNLSSQDIVLPGRWKLPPRSFYLADVKEGNSVVFPLSHAACELLLALPKDTPWVLPGRGPRGHIVAIDKTWQRCRAEASAAELKVHDLRATVSTWMARARVDYRVRQRVLNHAPVPGITDKIYTDLPHIEDELREPLETHGRAVLKAAGVASGADLVESRPQSRRKRSKVLEMQDRNKTP